MVVPVEKYSRFVQWDAVTNGMATEPIYPGEIVITPQGNAMGTGTSGEHAKQDKGTSQSGPHQVLPDLTFPAISVTVTATGPNMITTAAVPAAPAPKENGVIKTLRETGKRQARVIQVSPPPPKINRHTHKKIPEHL